MAKAKTKNSINLVLLASIAAATLDGSDTPYMFVSDADAAPLLAHNPPLIEQNPGMANGEGHKATRATEAGIAYSKENAAGTMANNTSGAASQPKPVFALIDNVELPPIKRGGGVGTETYPFASMNVKQGFFVPATADRAEPAKALASTVSSATRRFAVQDTAQPMKTVKVKGGGTKEVPNMKPTKRFELRRIEDGAAYGYPGVSGALISRTQ